jgi:hypothetical protein
LPQMIKTFRRHIKMIAVESETHRGLPICLPTIGLVF